MPRLLEVKYAEIRQSTKVIGLGKHSKTDSNVNLQFFIDKWT